MSKKEPEKTLLEKYTYNTIDFVKGHSKKIIAVAVVLFVVLAGVTAVFVYIDTHNRAMQEAYAEIMDDYQETMMKDAPSEDEKTQAAERVIELTDKARFGYVKENGYYIAAGIYFQNKKYTEAKKYYELFLEKHHTAELAPLAMFQSAVCSEWLENTDEAFLIYKQMEADFQDTKYMERIVYDVARMYVKKGDIEKAKEYFNRVLTEYPSSHFASQSKKRLMLLNLDS